MRLWGWEGVSGGLAVGWGVEGWGGGLSLLRLTDQALYQLVAHIVCSNQGNRTYTHGYGPACEKTSGPLRHWGPQKSSCVMNLSVVLSPASLSPPLFPSPPSTIRDQRFHEFVKGAPHQSPLSPSRPHPDPCT